MVRPRRITRATLEFDATAYQILEAAATIVLHQAGLLDHGYVTKEDLVSIGWERVFFYLKDPATVRKGMFLWAKREMRWYLRELKLRPYVPIHVADRDDRALNLPSARALDDPPARAILREELARMDVRERRIVYGVLIEGYTPGEMGGQIARTAERVRQIVKNVRRRMAQAG